MPSRRRSRLPLLAASLTLAACSSGPNSIDKQLLRPPVPWLAEPADFGLAAETIDVPIHSEASFTGFWIPHENGEKRTVVLFHDGATNASVMHPYYRFLHAAGFQVLAFDPRGFGKSKGTPTLQAWLYDLPILFRWLRARSDVDPDRIALFGTGMGSLAALWAARTQGCQALVLEHLPSLRDQLRAAHGGEDNAITAMQVGFAEFSNLPEEIEPDDNAPRTTVPALFVTTDAEPAGDRRALVRTFGTYAGKKQLWVLEHTGQAPHAMLTHDGEYQQQITSFLAGALAGKPPVFTTSAKKVDTARDGQAWYQIDVTPLPAAGNKTALEACAILADGSAHFARAWLDADNPRPRLRLKLPSEPVATTAIVVPGATEDAEAVFRHDATPLSRAGAAVDALWTRIESLRNDSLPAAEARQLWQDLTAAETKAAFPKELEAELADVFARLGKQLAASQDASERTTGQQLLQRAVAAMPAKPQLHLWPGPTATYGYPQEEAVEMAKRLLAAPPK